MFTIEKEQLATIKKICKISPNKSSNQAFECVHISAKDNAVTFTCGDGTSETSATIASDTTLNFDIMVSALKFSQSISATNGGVVELKDDLIIKNGRRRFSIKTIDPELFPFFKDPISESPQMNVNELMTLVDSVSFSAAVADVRYMLNGVHIGKHAVATNGHRMALVEVSSQIDDFVTIPIEAIKKMDMSSGDVFLSKSNISVIGDHEYFKCKLIDGQYPSYERVIPSDLDKHVTVNRIDFIDALKAAIVSAPSDNKMVRFIAGDESRLESVVNGVSSATIGFDCECNHNVESGFNSSYLLDAFNAVQSECITMQFNDTAMMIDQDGIKIIVMRVIL